MRVFDKVFGLTGAACLLASGMYAVACDQGAATGSTRATTEAPEVEQAAGGEAANSADVPCSVTLGTYSAPTPETPGGVTRAERRVTAQATASAQTHAGACRLAAAQARAQARGTSSAVLIPSRVLSVDGVEVAELMARGASPSDLEGEERRCELVVAFAEGERSTGTGEGPSLEEAEAVARAQACQAFGETSCANSEGFSLRVGQRNTHMSIRNGAMTNRVQVTVELTRVRRVRAEAAGRSRPGACRAALESACGGPTCGEHAVLEELDGVEL